MKNDSFSSLTKRLIARGGIFIFFIMAFEIMIMISPFAFFFYSVFNPLFKFIDHYPALRWLTSFFLPHMILPPTRLLTAIRILGSVLFVAGCLSFIVCALQVYLGKIFKWGIADKGLYKIIRHPQYLALGTWGIGMCILWPRFIVLASLSIMFVLYYFLAKDEERRMTAIYGESYKNYMQRTGMFVLPFIERRVSSFMPNSKARPFLIPALIVTVVIGTGFALRETTLHSIPFATENNLTLISILPEDNNLDKSVLDGITMMQNDGNENILKENKDYLGYLMPADYIMQGMIANTGSDFHLFKKHHTIAMITEWVFHPFEHLRASPSLHMAKMHRVDPAFARRHHCPLGINDPEMQCNNCPYRRVILVEIEHSNARHYSGRELFSFDVTRVPVCYVDINTQTGEIINIKQVEKATAWQDVPTPAI